VKNNNGLLDNENMNIMNKNGVQIHKQPTLSKVNISFMGGGNEVASNIGGTTTNNQPNAGSPHGGGVGDQHLSYKSSKRNNNNPSTLDYQ
jgi:hypothetical protein